jgi:hypothetical protein
MQCQLPCHVDTYAGLLDDSVWRYPWTPPGGSENLDLVLARQFLFGGRLLINDGYLVAQPELFAALGDPVSLLVQLIAAGHAAVLSTRRPISSSILDRARSGVATHAALVEDPDWPDIATMLDQIDERYDRHMQWPGRDLTPGFTRLARNWAARQLGALDDFSEVVLNQLLTDQRAPRTQWETLANEELSAGRLSRLERAAAMQAANQIYHLNFTAALAADNDKPLIAYTFLNETLLKLIGCELSEMTISNHEVPKFTISPDDISTLVLKVLGDPALMILRARYMNGGPDEEAASAYGAALAGLSSPGDMQIEPPRFFDQDTRTLHIWNDGGPLEWPARVWIDPVFANSLLGEGVIFQQE